MSYGASTIQGDAGFFPSTVWCHLLEKNLTLPQIQSQKTRWKWWFFSPGKKTHTQGVHQKLRPREQCNSFVCRISCALFTWPILRIEIIWLILPFCNQTWRTGKSCSSKLAGSVVLSWIHVQPHTVEIQILSFPGWWFFATPLKNHSIRQWEGWHPIYEMEVIKTMFQTSSSKLYMDYKPI